MGCGAQPGSAKKPGSEQVSEQHATITPQTAQGQPPPQVASSVTAPSRTPSKGPELPPQCLRLVVNENRIYKLNRSLADRAILKDQADQLPTQLPNKEYKAGSWIESSCFLEEAPGGLVMTTDAHGCKESKCIAQWDGIPDHNRLSVAALLPISLMGEFKHKEKHMIHHDAETPADPEDKRVARISSRVDVVDIEQVDREDPTDLYPLVLKWVEFQGTVCKDKCTVFGFEYENVCERWKSSISVYSNLGRRFLSHPFWKLNHSTCEMLQSRKEASDLPAETADINNWRHRLTYLQLNRSPEELVLAYVSEKDEDLDVVCAFGSAARGPRLAKVEKLPTITMELGTPRAQGHAKDSAKQYMLSSGVNHPKLRPASHQKMVGALPTALHAMHIEWTQEEDGEEQLMNAVFGCEDAKVLCVWLDVIAQESNRFSIVVS
mmetsp:Transcript_32282/g.57093  ORF Transcript_32282/g.57093 Transcript_32282/m.57093 type:complete len:435 (-) Transcript_32282:70-1374(-)